MSDEHTGQAVAVDASGDRLRLRLQCSNCGEADFLDISRGHVEAVIGALIDVGIRLGAINVQRPTPAMLDSLRAQVRASSGTSDEVMQAMLRSFEPKQQH